jgi:hypothetical protein
VFTPSRSFRSPLSATFLAALSLSVGLHDLSAQSDTSLDPLRPLPKARVVEEPFKFVGRLFEESGISFGSATLVRRHTALTAAHVVFNTTTGIAGNLTFTRALYDNDFLSQQSVTSVAVLSGYQTAVLDSGSAASLLSFSRDLAYVTFDTAPVDEDWSSFSTDAKLLTKNVVTQVNDKDGKPVSGFGRLVLGYPGVTFDARTQAFIVPTRAFVQAGANAPGLYLNQNYLAEEGMSGGPLYAITTANSVTTYTVVAETVGGIPDTSGAFTRSFVRAVDKEAGRFIASAEYITGLIKKVKISGPTTVTRGQTYTYTAVPKFKVRHVDTGAVVTTARYTELKLLSDAAGTATQPGVVIKKVSNTEFQVTFNTTLRAGARVNLTVQYSKNNLVPNSTLAILVQ